MRIYNNETMAKRHVNRSIKSTTAQKRTMNWAMSRYLVKMTLNMPNFRWACEHRPKSKYNTIVMVVVLVAAAAAVIAVAFVKVRAWLVYPQWLPTVASTWMNSMILCHCPFQQHQQMFQVPISLYSWKFYGFCRNTEPIPDFHFAVFPFVVGNRNRYRTPITSASVFDTLLEGPKMSYSVLGSSNSNSNSSTSDSSSTESLRNGN